MEASVAGDRSLHSSFVVVYPRKNRIESNVLMLLRSQTATLVMEFEADVLSFLYSIRLGCCMFGLDLVAAVVSNYIDLLIACYPIALAILWAEVCLHPVALLFFFVC